MFSLLYSRELFELEYISPYSLKDTIHDANVVRYSILAAFTLQIYDYIATLDDEIRYVWLWKNAFSRFVPFLLNRYLPFITVSSATYFLLLNPNQSLCRPAHFFVAGIALVGAIIAECTLFLKAYAVYERNRTVMTLLLISAAASIVGASINTIIYISRSSIAELDIGVQYSGCLYVYGFKIEWVSLVVLIFCESVVFCLLIAKAIWHHRYTNSVIMKCLCDDAIFCFVCTIGCSVVNLIIQHFASKLICDAFLIPQSVIQQILCARSFLHIRRSYELNVVTVNPNPSEHEGFVSDSSGSGCGIAA